MEEKLAIRSSFISSNEDIIEHRRVVFISAYFIMEEELPMRSSIIPSSEDTIEHGRVVVILSRKKIYISCCFIIIRYEFERDILKHGLVAVNPDRFIMDDKL